MLPSKLKYLLKMFTNALENLGFNRKNVILQHLNKDSCDPGGPFCGRTDEPQNFGKNIFFR